MARILIIEDNPANARLAAFILSRHGHEILCAEDALIGLDLARNEQPDLILMDIHLPGMDGLEATRRLRDDPVTADIRIIALTALAMRGDEERIRAAGCDAYLAKPFEHAQLSAAVHGLLYLSLDPESGDA